MDPPHEDAIFESKRRGRPHQSYNLGDIYNESKSLNIDDRKRVLLFIRNLKEENAARLIAAKNDNITNTPDNIITRRGDDGD